MKRFFLFKLFLLFTVFNTNASIALEPNDSYEKQRGVIERILRSSGISLNDMGIFISGEKGILFENQSQKKFIPASLSKIITAIAALKVFPAEQRMITELKSDSKISDSSLNGPLYIKGHGDPSFISEQMWVLVNNFARLGVKKVKGPIFVDSTIFDDKHFDESRQSVRVDRAYDSPVSGLSFNWNTVNIYLKGGKKPGEPLEIYLDPVNDYFTIENKTKTLSGNQPANINVDKKKFGDGEKITITGSMGIKQGEVAKYASVTYPDIWVGKNLIQFLSQRGIEVEDKKIQSKKAPSAASSLAEAKGWTLYEIVDGMMKFSNNFLAEMLTKNLALSGGANVGGIEKGVQEIKFVLEKNYGLKKNDYDFYSPSGFSSKNKITPKDLGTLMEKSYKDFSISSYLLSSMAAPQSEGTLSKRMSSLGEPRLVRAKTGLLSGVTGLAGYAGNSKSEVFTFVFMYNGKGKEAQARDLFDRMAIEVTRL